MRALRPEGALIRTDGDSLVTKRRPLQTGAGDWSHWEHGPDNNPVSTDTVIKAPYMTQFMARPYYIGMPSVTTAAAGRPAAVPRPQVPSSAVTLTAKPGHWRAA